MKKTRAVLALLSLVLTVAVGPNFGFAKNSVSHPLSVTGTWVIVSSACDDLTAVLTHTGTAIAGTVSDANNYPTGISGTSTLSAGSKSGSRNVSFTVTFSDGLWVTFAGTVNADNTTITGTYNNSQGFDDPFTARRQ
jgi:hypothetical protein